MPASRRKTFDNQAEELTEHINVTVLGYFQKEGLNTPKNKNWQSQMSTSVLDTAKELLMFGGDRWPAGIYENVLFPELFGATPDNVVPLIPLKSKIANSG